MSDNVQLNSGSGGVIAAADEISAGIYAQRVKPVIGADGTGVDVLPVSNGMDTTATGVPAAGMVGQFDDVSVGTVTENQFAPIRISSRRAQLVEGVAGGTAQPVSIAATVTVDGSGVTQPVSAASLPLPSGASTSAKQDTGNTSLASIDGKITAVNTGAVVVSSSALPTGAATAAKQPALGTAGTSSADVITVQGRASMTALVVDPSGVTSPVSLATNTPVGNIAHGTADSGAPIKIGYRADTTFQAAEADGDRVDGLADVYGVAYARGDHPNKWSYHENSSSALTDASVQGAPGAGLSVYITDIILSLGAATALNVFFEEGSTTIIGPYYLEAVNGRTIHIRFQTPKKCTANTALTVTTSAALAHGLDVLGFIAP